MPFRGRPFRPGRRPAHRRPAERLDPRIEKILARLRQAHRSMEAGRFTDAASIFHDLALKAEDHEIRRAPQLHLQTGRALILADSVDQGMDSLRYGLKLLHSLDQDMRFQTASQRVFYDLRSLGHDDLALQLENEFSGSFVPSASTPASAQAQERSHPPLPPSCPRCSAVVQPNELEWMNRTRAYCDYCGTILEGN